MQDVWAEYDALANQVICDPLVGELRPSEMGDPWWETTATICGRSVVFRIDGEEQPDPAVLAHAHQIVREFPAFERRLAQHLRAQSELHEKWGPEIEQQRLHSINLLWPERPQDAHITYTWPERPLDCNRFWQSNYVQDQFVGMILHILPPKPLPAAKGCTSATG